jgi:nucleoporin GLE1
VDESLSDYVSRMSGITTLYFGILQTPLGSLIPTIPMQPSPDQLEAIFAPALRFPSAWTWLSNALKDPTAGMPPIASMVSTWTKLMAAECAKLYGPGQMAKVFEAMKREGVEGGKIKGDSEAARVGLGLTLDKWQTLGVPSGRDWE